jgi:cyclin-dependent kinase regulatory subunit CKS1
LFSPINVSLSNLPSSSLFSLPTFPPLHPFPLPPPLIFHSNSEELIRDIVYSEKYQDDSFEYRHVTLPKELAKSLPKGGRLLTEMEWRQLGVQQSKGWVHYAIHRPEPHILLFRRELGTDPNTGKVNVVLRQQAIDQYNKEFRA